jgi:phosphatidate phosphatase PAH1
MRRLTISVAVLLSSGCAQLPRQQVPFPTATQHSVVITDIDGTLTPRNLDVNEPRPNAAAALHALVQKGYRIVYVTTRIPAFQSGLPEWLKQNGFPTGDLHVAQNADERSAPERFKTRILASYTELGWTLAYAYGDSSTDFAAYAAAHVPQQYVFALKRKGESSCQEGIYQMCLSGWGEHLPYIASEVPQAK